MRLQRRADADDTIYLPTVSADTCSLAWKRTPTVENALSYSFNAD